MVGGGVDPPRTVNDLRTTLIDERAIIPQNDTDWLIWIMPNLCDECMNARAVHTSYWHVVSIVLIINIMIINGKSHNCVIIVI